MLISYPKVCIRLRFSDRFRDRRSVSARHTLPGHCRSDKGIKPSSPVPEQGDSRSTVPVGFDSVPVEVPAAPGNVIPVQNDTPDALNKASPKPVAPVPPTVPVSKPDVPVAPNKKECKCKNAELSFLRGPRFVGNVLLLKRSPRKNGSWLELSQPFLCALLLL